MPPNRGIETVLLWLTKRPALALALLIVLGGISCVGQAPASPTSQARITGSAGTPFVSISAGAPVTAAVALAKLPVASGDQLLTPIAARGDGLVLAAAPAGNRFRPSAYELWTPANGAVTPLSGWQPDASISERIDGVWGDWILIEHGSASSSGAVSLRLRNIQSGEVRELTSSADPSVRSGGSQVGTDGRITWLAAASGPSVLHVYDIASATDTEIPMRFAPTRRFSLGGGRLAWVVAPPDQAPRIVVRDLKGGTPQSFAAGQITSLVLSGDGQSAVWIERSSDGKSELLARNVDTGATVRVLSGDGVGFSISASGAYVSWQPRPGTAATAAGFYNVQTHELRLVQSPPNRTPYFAAVIGDWFVWIEGDKQAVTGTPGPSFGIPPGPDSTIYALKLRH